MVVQLGIEKLSYIAQTTSDIAPVAPANYGAIRVPGSGALLLATYGTADPKKEKYPGVLFCPGENGKAKPQPIGKNTGNAAFMYDMTVGPEALINGSVIETDFYIVTGGYRYEMTSLQRHIQKTAGGVGQLDIGNWTNTKLYAGALVADHTYPVRIAYFWDLTKHLCSVLSYSDGGTLLTIPAALQNMAGTPSNWAEGAYIQLQLGSIQNPGEWSIMYDNIEIEWW